jgi:flagellin
MISINVNPAASGAGLNLGKANDALQKSLSRLSSGQRIVTSSDDAGGLAVSMKMSAALKRTEATAINLRNMVSYLDTQDGAFKVADKVLSRMSELSSLARDVSKNPGDIENYDKEFGNLKDQLLSLSTEKFNGVKLFEDGALIVPTSEDGSQQTSVTSAELATNPMMDMMINGFRSIQVGDQLYVVPKNDELTNTGTNGSTVTAYALPGGIGSPVDLTLEVNRTTSSTIIAWPDTGNPDGSITWPSGATTGHSFTQIEVRNEFEISIGTTTVGSYVDTSYQINAGTTAATGFGVSLSTGYSSQINPDYDPVLGTSSTYSTGIETNMNYENSKFYSYLSQEALQEVADMRAQNGAEMSRINFAQDLLNINAVNLEAANSRIMDVDVAAESSQLARFQILQQAGTAMLAQANTSQQSLVRLLQG